MSSIELKKSTWSTYFDKVTRALEGKQALIEVGALPIGNQVEVRWLALRGITYDRKDDLLDLDLGDIEHVIEHPAEIHVDASGNEILSIEVVDAEKTKHLVRLRDPLLLPAK